MLRVHVLNHEGRRIIKAARRNAYIRNQRAFENHILGQITETLTAEIQEHLEDPDAS